MTKSPDVDMVEDEKNTPQTVESMSESNPDKSWKETAPIR
jgi:hypothetical protein